MMRTAAATIVVVIVAAVALRLDRPADPLNADHDIPHYATVLVSADANVNFARDPIFAGRNALVWRAASGYMSVFRGLYVVARRDFATTLVLFQLLLVAIYFPSITLLLRRTGASDAVAIAVAAISIVESSFLVTGTRWGILTPPVPLVMCTALSPLVALLAMRWPLFAGTVIAIPMLFVNPATGLALVELALIVALFAALRGVLRWRDFAIIVASAAIWVIVARFNIAATTRPFSFDDAAEVIRYGQQFVMVYPFRGAGVRGIAAMLALHAGLTLFFLLIRRPIPLILVQAASAIFFLRAGWLVLFPLAYSLRKRGEDSWLWLLLGISIAIGPLQQVALLAAFDRMHATGVTSILFECARFMQFAYLVLFALVARAIDAWSDGFGRLRVAAIAFVSCAALLNLNVSPFDPRAGSLWIAAISALWLTSKWWRSWFDDEIDGARSMVAIVFGVAIVLGSMAVLAKLGIRTVRVPIAVGACAAFVLFAIAHTKRDARAFVAACVAAAVIGGPWLILTLREPVGANALLFELKLPRAERGRKDEVKRCDYKSLAAQLPPNSLSHLMTFDRGFRPLAGRAMLPVSDEWLIPIYNGAPVRSLRAETEALWNTRNDLAQSKILAKQYGADHVVTCDAVYSLN